ncbi:ABC transporter permease subunit [Halorubrum halodurans]|uniref:PrsW family intramembrane metalloprotease n=1 Tax=Halorubrum halodurans TaxID=1383851 RepID=A0A256IAR3_9EURY|nr:ABC transporter permease subunit [Halorubrum halodurans]OYR53543.1 PrsW family intramembrane metalloprotease [Halorubrum halodurans]
MIRRATRRIARRSRRVVRVARWEASRATGGVDRRTLLAAVAFLAVAGGVFGAGAATGTVGLDVDRDVYRVGVDPASPYADAVEGEPALTAVPIEEATLGSTVDLVVREVRGGGSGPADVFVRAVDTPKGEAAAASFREAVDAHNERLMAAESNGTAAFPVVVTLRYVSRGSALDDGRTVGDASTAGAASDADGSDDAGAAVDDGGDDGIRGDGDDVDTGAGSGTDDGDGGSNSGGSVDGDAVDGERGDDGRWFLGGGGTGDLAIPSIGGGAFGASSTGSPGSITPPFPFASLVLAFAFLVPMNFLAQAYGSSVLEERTNRRGEPLLVTPLSPAEIVAGKTLPYVAVAVAVTALIALVVGGGPISVLAVLPIAATFLAATFVGAVFARSFKELTFVTVAVSVLLTSYAFVPAIFTNVTPVALISPLTLVVFDLQGEAISVGEFLFATGPTAIAAALLFGLGLGVYREEDLFTQKPVTRKFLDALAVRLSAVGEGVRESPATGVAARLPRRARGPAAVAFLTACTIPFVFVAELLAVAVLFALPITVSIPVLLVVIAFVEEVAKSVHLYAGFERGVFARTDRVAIAVGLASGLGFFLAEKATAVVQAVGLTELYVGRAAFGSVAGVAGLSPLLLAGLFLAPLALHGVTASLSAVGARRDRTRYVLALAAATLVHAAYNVGVVSLHG